MLSFFRKGSADGSSRRPLETVPCPHCGSDVPATSVACRHCGYDWESELDDEVAADDFDYEEFVEREFGDPSSGPRSTSTTLRPWQRAIAVVLIIAFALTLLGPLLF